MNDVDFYVTVVKDFEIVGYWIGRKNNRILHLDPDHIPLEMIHPEYWQEIRNDG